MKISEYIHMLQEFSKTCDDLQVVITQSGYYADGDVADLYSIPEVKEVVFRDATYKYVDIPGVRGRTRVLVTPASKERTIVLGHSHQSY